MVDRSIWLLSVHRDAAYLTLSGENTPSVVGTPAALSARTGRTRRPPRPGPTRSWSRLGAQPGVGLAAGGQIGPPRVGLVARRQDGVGHAPVGGDLGVVPRHA